MPKANDIETVERVIHAPPSSIFDLLADPHRHPQIDGSGTVHTKPDTLERLTLGSKFGGGRIWRYELEPVAGGTRVRESWDITREKVKAIVRPARKKTKKAMEKTLARIEELVA